MSVQTFSNVIDGSGRVNVSFLSNLDIDPEDTVSVVATLGAYGLRQSVLLDQIFGTSFSATNPRVGIAAAYIEGEDAAVIAEARHHIVALDVEPFDGPDRKREEARERAAHTALAVSDVVIFVARMPDLHRADANGVTALRASLTETLLMQADGVVPTPPGKRAFVVVVREYEDEVLSRQEVVSGFLQEMQAVYSSVAKPPRSPQRVLEMFEFEFVLMPNERLLPDAYNDALSKLKAMFTDPAADDYLFENARFVRDTQTDLAKCTEAAWKRLEAEQVQDMPEMKDLMSTFDCDNVMRKVFEKYQHGVRVWRRETEGGVIIEKFGASACEMVEKTMQVFDQDAGPHKGSKAYKRKREELKDLLDADLYSLFVIQIAKLREVTYRLFKEKLDAIDDSNTRLDKTVNSALKESQKYFQVNAEALRPGFSSWRYDSDSKELATQMREDATDRLQRARLSNYQDSSGRRGRRRRPGTAAVASSRKKRQPINVGFHYLALAPFGWKDSRYEKLSVKDNLQFNSDVPALGAGSGGGNSGGLSIPLTPTRESGWHQNNQDFIYSEKK